MPWAAQRPEGQQASAGHRLSTLKAASTWPRPAGMEEEGRVGGDRARGHPDVRLHHDFPGARTGEGGEEAGLEPRLVC